MNILNEKLAKILAIGNEEECAKSFEAFCKENASQLPLPGENKNFDKAMWAASKFTKLSSKDQGILGRVTAKMIGESVVDIKKAVLNLRELVGSTKQAAIDTWQDMLASMQWQQMVPAGAMRGVGTQLVSLGTFQKNVDDVNIQVNLGWHVDKDQLRVLAQAKGAQQEALSNVEVRITEAHGDVVFTRKTNEDGSVVAPSVSVKPGDYKIQVLWLDNIIETPFFRV
jgi:hypothetical protein